ncbi:hypothetical protein FRC12_005028 [Ceratobasidium sp. 428]|nr:hypothetical protein FRC12_005028 [Ceratobasidium sp. 428]
MSIDLLPSVVERLQLEATQTVETAVARFINIPSPPETQFITISNTSPTVFTSLDILNKSLDFFFTLPSPSPSQLAEVRELLGQASSQHPPMTPMSLCVTTLESSCRVYLPTWIVQIWPRLHSFIQLALAWDKAILSLIELSDSSDNAGSLALLLLNRVLALSFDSPTPNSVLQHIRTSHLPTLIQTSWLSDNHLDAASELINWHPNCMLGVRALNTHFLDYMRRQFTRSPTYLASRLTNLDRLVMESTVTELLIPFHQPSHWVLLHVDIAHRRYSFTDTLDLGKTLAPPVTIGLLNRWLTSLLGLDIVLAPPPRAFGVGPQFDSSSCGVAVMSTMAYYALDDSEASPNPPAPETFLEDLSDDTEGSTLSACSNAMDSSSTISSDFSLGDGSGPSYAPTTPIRPPPTQTPLRQSTLPFRSIPCSEWLAQEKRKYADRLVERQDKVARFEQLKSQKKAKRRQYERNRKRVRRAQQKKVRAAAQAAKKLALDTKAGNNLVLDLRQ